MGNTLIPEPEISAALAAGGDSQFGIAFQRRHSGFRTKAAWAKFIGNS